MIPRVSVATVAFIALSASLAQAEPTQLAPAQMDAVTAGAVSIVVAHAASTNGGSASAIIAAKARGSGSDTKIPAKFEATGQGQRAGVLGFVRGSNVAVKKHVEATPGLILTP